MTKRKVLLAVCENPGWQPEEPVEGAVARYLDELAEEGWIVPRLDGWESTSLALEAYPVFAGQRDIQDPDVPVEESPTREPTFGRPLYARDPCVPESKEWESEFVLAPLVLGTHHQVQAPIDVGSWVRGGVTLANARPDGQRIEVEIVVRTRRTR